MPVFDVPSTAVLPRQYQFWPGDKTIKGPAALQEAYEQGFAGAFKDPQAAAEFDNMIVGAGGDVEGERVSAASGLKDSGKGRLVIPFVYVEKMLKGCWPGAAQERGDCVSHDTRNACLTTMVCDVVGGLPDEVTGKREMLPVISDKGLREGYLSSEAYYWYRGYNGDGWSCDAAANVAITRSGIWLRQPYPELGIDLTEYSGSLAGKYGRVQPPQAITTFGQKHLFRTATRLRSKEERRDFLANGYGISTCGGESFSNQRDKYGMSPRTRKGWAHAFAQIGFDDRPEIWDLFGDSLELFINSWAIWNSGPRTIYGTDIQIPEGAWWCRSKDVQYRSFIAISGANGFEAKSERLPAIQLVVG